jgi:hypothetical protein
VNLDLGIWVLTKHKTFHKTGKPRIIYLNEEMVKLTRKLVAMYPEGPLFRGPISKKGFMMSDNYNARPCCLTRECYHAPHWLSQPVDQPLSAVSIL